MNSIVTPTLDEPTASLDDGPKYDEAYLQELKASNLNARPPRPSNVDTNDGNLSMDVDQIAFQSADIEFGMFFNSPWDA